MFIGEGIALGVEIAQREASVIPNLLDHFIQNNGCPIERYMDDTFFLVDDYSKAKELLNHYYLLCDKLHLRINKSKTKIIKVGNYFTYCKWKYNIDSNGKVICIPARSTIYRQRRKLRKMYKLNLDINDINITRTGFKAYLNIGNIYNYIKYLDSIENSNKFIS